MLLPVHVFLSKITAEGLKGTKGQEGVGSVMAC